MIQRNPWQSYRQVATKTASPGQLVLMLFEGAIGFLERALNGFTYEDPLEFNLTISNNVLRAQAIINELNLSLNMAEGGDISLHLRKLYTYMDRTLQESNQHKTREGIVDVLGRLNVLRDTWSQMLQQGVEKPAGNTQLVA
jgi:flagellar secretion chaperone FliS